METKINLKEFAQKLDKCEYGNISNYLIQEAKEKGIIIVYGMSDDLIEFDGAIYDEVDCYNGGICYLNENGVLKNDCKSEECPYFEKEKQKSKSIEAIWCEKDMDWLWSYKTDIPHETFEMYDNNEKYCLGIVFFKKELKK